MARAGLLRYAVHDGRVARADAFAGGVRSQSDQRCHKKGIAILFGPDLEIVPGWPFAVRDYGYDCTDTFVIHELWDHDTDTYHVHGRQDVQTVVDIGGNIGGFSLLMCRLYPSATIVTYEPEPENYQVLLENLSRMDHRKQVTPHNMAIWSESGEIYLSAGSNAAYSMHLGSPAHVCDGGQICGAAQCSHTPQAVPCVTLNEVLSALPPVDILKMDAEGAEFVVLPHADLSKVKFLCLEAHEVYSNAAAVESLVATLNETHDMKNGTPEIWYGELR